LSLQRDRWNVLHSLPNRTQAVIRESKRDGVVTEFHPNRDWVGRQRTFERDGSVEPREKDVRFFGIEDGILQSDQLVAAAFEHDPLETIGSDADEALAFLALAVGEIIRHAPDHVIPFLIEIALGLEHSTPDESIEPTPYFGNAALEIKRTEFNAEFFHQEFAEVGLHLVVPRTGGEMVQERASPRISGQDFSSVMAAGPAANTKCR